MSFDWNRSSDSGQVSSDWNRSGDGGCITVIVVVMVAERPPNTLVVTNSVLAVTKADRWPS